jgi:hypothetical protein
MNNMREFKNLIPSLHRTNLGETTVLIHPLPAINAITDVTRAPKKFFILIISFVVKCPGHKTP